MNPYDKEQVQAVWERVRGKPQEAELCRQLPEMIGGEESSAGYYETLARYAGGDRGLLLRLAREEKRHAKQLRSLYALLSDSPAPIASGIGREKLPFFSAIRQCFRSALDAAETYKTAAGKWPAHEGLFRSLAREELRHSQLLHQIALRHSPKKGLG